MVIHKFKIGGEKGLTFYMLSDTRSRPAGTNSTMGTPEWVGSSTEGTASNLASRLSGLKEFSKEESPAKETPEETPATPEKCAAELDKIAAELESESPVIALALDRISDQIDRK